MSYIGRYQPPLEVVAGAPAMHTVADARTQYHQALKATGAKLNTQIGAVTAIGLAAEFLDDTPLASIRRGHIEQLAGAYASRCHKALTFSPTHCTAGYPLAACPWLTGADPTTCASYEPNQASSVQTFLGILHPFFDWLVDAEAIAANPVRAVLKSHAKRNKAALARKRMTPGKAQLTVDQWRTLVRASTWHNRPMWDLAGKNGLRPHEVVKLHRSGYDRQNRRIAIPEDTTDFYGNKRIGWFWALVDDESTALLDAYVARRDSLPAAAKHDMLFVTRTGQPWSPKNWDKTLRNSFKRDLRRAELNSAATPHSLRGMFNTAIRDAPDAVRAILRGGKLPGHESAYVFNDGIRDDWERFHPRLGADVLTIAMQF